MCMHMRMYMCMHMDMCMCMHMHMRMHMHTHVMHTCTCACACARTCAHAHAHAKSSQVKSSQVVSSQAAAGTWLLSGGQSSLVKSRPRGGCACGDWCAWLCLTHILTGFGRRPSCAAPDGARGRDAARAAADRLTRRRRPACHRRAVDDAPRRRPSQRPAAPRARRFRGFFSLVGPSASRPGPRAARATRGGKGVAPPEPRGRRLPRKCGQPLPESLPNLMRPLHHVSSQVKSSQLSQAWRRPEGLVTLGEHGDARRALIVAAGRRWWGAGLGGVRLEVGSQFVCSSMPGGAVLDHPPRLRATRQRLRCGAPQVLRASARGGGR